jgi:hypothetical protein
MSREVIGYVVREGKVRGQGRYHRANDAAGTALGNRADAHVWDTDASRRLIRSLYCGDTLRIVAIVRKAKARNCPCPCDLGSGCTVSRERDIARADQKRAEESKAAAWEQVRGRDMRIAELEAQIARVKKVITG